MHVNIARATGTKWQHNQRNGDFTIDVPGATKIIAQERPTLVFLTSPNNPTGTITPISQIEQLAQACAEVNALLIVDEAYQEFSNERSAVTLIEAHPNIVVCRTMSKAFEFAGARLGYLVGNQKVVDAMLLVRLPYHLSSATQSLASVALNYAQELLANVAVLSNERERIRLGLANIGVTALPSGANFFLFETTRPAQLWQELLEQGVLVRDVGLAGYLRVTVGRPEENELFIKALTHALGKGSAG